MTDEFDPRPWAAYVLGHHPHALNDLHESHWWAVTANRPKPERGSWLRIPRVLREFDRALSILSKAYRVDAGVLDCVRSRLGEFDQIHRDLTRICNGQIFESDLIRNWDRRLPAGFGPLDTLCRLSKELIGEVDALRPYLTLGSWVGSRRSPFSGHPEATHGDLRSVIQGVIDSVRFPFPEANSLGTFLESAGLSGLINHLIMRPTLVSFDEFLRRTLGQFPKSQPVLILDSKSMRFFDQEFDYCGQGFTQSWFAILWLLAERVKSPLVQSGELPRHLDPSEIINTEYVCVNNEPSLGPILSRFRTKILRPAVSRYYKSFGRLLPTELKKFCCIGPPRDMNKNSRNNKGYELYLESEQVELLSHPILRRRS